MHDTAGPVTTIKGAVKLLKSGNLSPEDTLKMLDAISERADRINATLDVHWNDIKNGTDPQWQELWEEFRKTPHFPSIHKHNLSASYLKWLQEKCHKPYFKSKM